MTRRPNWSARSESNARSPAPKAGGLATFPHADGVPRVNRTPAPRFRKPRAASSGRDNWSGRLDLNQRSLGSEPSTFARLNYTPKWSGRSESNGRSPVSRTGALAATLRPDGAPNGDRTRLSLLDRQVPSPDDYRRKLEDAEGIEPVLISGLKDRRLHQQATRPWCFQMDSNHRFLGYRPSVLAARRWKQASPYCRCGTVITPLPQRGQNGGAAACSVALPGVGG